MDDSNKYSYTPTPIACLKKNENEENSEYVPTLIGESDWYKPDSIAVAYNPNFQFDKKICATPKYGPSSTEISSSSHSSKIFKPVSKKKEIKKQKLENLIKDLYDSSESEENTEPTNDEKRNGNRLSLPDSIRMPPRPVEVIKVEEPPSEVISERPKMPLRPCTFVPLPIRMRYLDQFVDYYLKFCSTEKIAYKRALDDEQSAIEKSLNRPKYLRAVVEKLRELKDIVDRTPVVRKPPVVKKPLISPPKAQVLNSSQKATPSNRPFNSSLLLRDLTFDERVDQFIQTNYIYGYLKEFILTNEQLYENGFPITGSFKGSCKIKIPDKVLPISELPKNTRICCRCNAKYTVDSYGHTVNKNICEYHWGKPISMKGVTGWQAKYLCCQMPVGTSGCCVCKNGHVSDANRWFDTQEGYFELLPALDKNKFDLSQDELNIAFSKFLTSTKVPRNATEKAIDEVCMNALPKGDCKIFALDCEMVYTTKGYELARVTIVDSRCHVIMDKLVKPSGLILDCNSRFSGLNPEDFDNVNEYLTHIQLEMLKIFDSETILMGHSLENDLISLKITHDKIVDTSVVFPHKYGPPKKRALKNLAIELINMPIQNNIDGHDSKEDAVAVMKIMQHKVKDIVKKNLRTCNL